VKPAKIVKLDIQNVMRIDAVHIEPGEGNVVVLGGRNAQGKTSVLDAISVAIGGMKLCPDVPIKDGQDEAEISIQLGELLVTRKFKRKGDSFTSSVVVKNAEGQPLTPPQKTLDALIGRLAFDPLEFARMSPADARETLRALVGLDVEQLEDELGRIFRQRTEAGVEKRGAQAVVDDLPVPQVVPAAISVSGEVATMRAAVERTQELEKLKGIHARHGDAAQQLANERDDLEVRVEKIQQEIDKHLESECMSATAIANFILPDIEAIQLKIDDATHHNQQVAAKQVAADRFQRKSEEASACAMLWKNLDTEHNGIARKIKKLTEAVEYPIEDLELRPEGVFYQGVPFEQGSRAERIKVSLAMGMAMNDKLRILLIRDGSVLDAESMATIAKLAEEKDFQFWIEMARGYEGAAGAVVIEDGGVV
jgi:DNA repair exonuclease SbcCD ATPase subunit